MPDRFFDLTPDDQREFLLTASETLGRPPYLLEKDAWVVRVLSVLGEADAGKLTVFKGGTSLSKAFRVLDRFSEDIDLTVDIRRMLPEETERYGVLPPSRSQADRWKRKVEDERLPDLLANDLAPLLRERLAEQAGIVIDGTNIHVRYRPVTTGQQAYVQPEVLMEFGGLSTAEPHSVMTILCDAAGFNPGIEFPAATVKVMSIQRTFWEKVTAAHAYCVNGKMRKERFSRHWHDIARIYRSEHGRTCSDDFEIAKQVVKLKAMFFRESGANYDDAISGRLRLVPSGEARARLETDYAQMAGAGMFDEPSINFSHIIDTCAEIAESLNTRPS